MTHTHTHAHSHFGEIARQTSSRLAHDDAAHAELLAEGHLAGQRVAGIQNAALDLATQPFFDLVVVGNAAGLIQAEGLHGDLPLM